MVKTEEKTRQRLIFSAGQFVECNIASSMTKGLRTYERTNGKATLSLTAISKKHELPSGKDRLLFYWLRTQATMNKSRIIDFPGVNATLEDMRQEVNGRNANWLKDSILRSHHTHIYYTKGDLMKGGSSQGELIIPKIEGINFEEKRKHQKGKLTVSEHFYDGSSIPIDLEVIQKLGRCWIGMDMYTFVNKRLYSEKQRAGRDIFIKPEELAKQFGFSPDTQPKDIRRYFERGIDALKDVNYAAIPYFNENKTFVIPYVELRSILTLEAQIAFEELDERAGQL
jgi:hypothetical protein